MFEILLGRNVSCEDAKIDALLDAAKRMGPFYPNRIMEMASAFSTYLENLPFEFIITGAIITNAFMADVEDFNVFFDTDDTTFEERIMHYIQAVHHDIVRAQLAQIISSDLDHYNLHEMVISVLPTEAERVKWVNAFWGNMQDCSTILGYYACKMLEGNSPAENTQEHILLSRLITHPELDTLLLINDQLTNNP